MRKMQTKLCLLILALFLAGTAGSNLFAQSSPVDKEDIVRGEILVKFKSSALASEIEAAHNPFSARSIYRSPRGGFERVTFDPRFSEVDVARAYNRLPCVEYAEINTICRTGAVPNDSYYSYQWHFPMINMPEAWDVSTGSGVVVAILDSGVAYENYTIPSHEAGTVASGVTQYQIAPDLTGTSFVAGYDFINNDSHANDNNGHGTHVAGTVAQTTNNNYGVAGMAYNASIMPVKVLDYTGSGDAGALADGLYFAADNGADVVNMSLSWSPGYNPGSTVSNAVIYAYNAGVVLVAASGNADTGTVSYPAAYSQVIAVGAVRYDYTLSYYSQWGTAQEIVAPGGDVNVDQNGDGYIDGVLQNTMTPYSNYFNKANPTSFSYYFFQGTSMASPHVAGLVALMISNGTTGVENIRSVLHDSAYDLGASGWDSSFGYGLIDAAAALAGGTPADTTPPDPDPMSWSTAPYATGTTSISMTASTATDPNGVQYYFDCLTSGGHDSGWQSGTTYVDTGLSPDTTYTYRVKARDLSTNQNETGYSGNGAATTDPIPSDTTPPNPDPMSWATVPYATGTTSITMTASTATDPSGVEYFFDCLTAGGHDSAWQLSTTYVDTGLSPDTTYTYRVKARDLSGNLNETGYSGNAAATTDPQPVDTTAPNPDPMTWATVPNATGTTSISMTATIASDPSGVEYYFDCLTAGGNDSGWQSGTTYVDTGLTPDTSYTYRVMARDLSANQNATAYSANAAASTDPEPQGWVELTYDDFEGGWGNYVDGGRDCSLYTGGTYAHQGSNAADIQDNRGVGSSFYYANGVDVHNPGYTQIKIEFWYMPVSMDKTGEDFWVQYYNGSSWQTVAVYDKGVDFENNNFYNETVIINEGSYNFPTNMKIRFMCDASGNKDDVFIDEIRVSAQ